MADGAATPSPTYVLAARRRDVAEAPLVAGVSHDTSLARGVTSGPLAVGTLILRTGALGTCALGSPSVRETL